MNAMLIDYSAGERRKSIAKALKAAGLEVTIMVFGKREIEQLSKDTGCTIVTVDTLKGTEFDILIRHNSDARPSSGAMEKLNVPVKVCYSGSGGNVINQCYEGEWRIEPAILYEEFTAEMAKELEHFAANGSSIPSWLLSAVPKWYNREREEKLRSFYGNKLPEFKKPTAVEGVLDAFELEEGAAILIIWDKVNVNGGKLLQCLGNIKFPKVSLVSNQADWEAILVGSMDYDAAIICVELTWDEAGYHTAFEGVEKLTTLRRLGFRKPVVMASWSNGSYLLDLVSEKKTLDFSILATPYQYLWDMESGEISGKDELTAIKDKLVPSMIGKQLLEDINFSIGPGKVGSIIHSAKTRLINTRETDESRKIGLREVESAFALIRTLVSPERMSEYEELKNQVLEKLKTMKVTKWATFFSAKKADIEALLRVEDRQDEGALMQQANWYDWEALILEDDEETAKNLISKLNQAGINSYHKKDPIETLEMLDRNYRGEEGKSPNSITVVLVDFRLEEKGRWSVLQGYDFIRQAGTLENMLSYFVFTNKTSSIIRAARQQMNVGISWYAKDVLLQEGACQMFIDDIIGKGADNWDALGGLIEVGFWKKGDPNKTIHSLNSYYKLYRKHPNYHATEEEINRTVRTWLKIVSIQDKINKLEKSNKEVINKGSEVMNMEITKFNKEILDCTKEEQSLLSCLKSEFRDLKLGTTFKGKKGNSIESIFEDNFTVFVQKLTGRRLLIVLARYMRRGVNTRGDIYEILRNDKDVENIIEYENSIINKFLGLPTSKYNMEGIQYWESNKTTGKNDCKLLVEEIKLLNELRNVK